MGPGYDINFILEEFEELMGMSLFATLLSEIPSMLISLATYIFTALALYTIAKRRGIHNPWLAWIPFANTWLFGCISDQYRSVARGEVKNRRKVLLGTEIATSAIAIVMLVLCFGMLFDMLAVGLDNWENMSESMASELLAAVMGPVVGICLLCLPLMVLAIVHAVFAFIALYDIYKSCDPANATLYLVLSIFIGIAQPVFLFICRNKDDGMPAPAAEQPFVMEQPAFEPPQWQPAQPPVEPWEQKNNEE